MTTSHPIKIRVRGLSGENFMVETLGSHSSLYDLKKIISDRSAIPADSF